MGGRADPAADRDRRAGRRRRTLGAPPAAHDIHPDSPPESRTDLVWSDLHLGDPSVLDGWDRPFRNVRHINPALLAEWRRRVRPGDTIICLGDVAHFDALARRQPTAVGRRRLPGLAGRAAPATLTTEHPGSTWLVAIVGVNPAELTAPAPSWPRNPRLG